LMTSRGMPRDVTGGHFCFHQMPMYVPTWSAFVSWMLSKKLRLEFDKIGRSLL
jgi:hypothetical protein